MAVLVDGSWKKDATSDEMVYTKRSQEDMDQLKLLVRHAVGIKDDRGDIFEVINMQFDGGEAPAEEPLQLFFGFDKQDLLKLAQTLFLGIVAILIILLIGRPLVSRVFDMMNTAREAASESQMLAAQAGAPALTGPGRAGDQGFEELIDIDRVEGRVKASSVKKVGEIVSKHPEEAISIVRAWMYQET